MHLDTGQRLNGDNLDHRVWNDDSCSESPFRVGRTRLVDPVSQHVGTVAYVGTVASAPAHARDEPYVGVVWDPPGTRNDVKGKHDGSVVCSATGQVIRYFTTPRPMAASFVPLKKVLKATEPSFLGWDLTPEFVRKRYVPIDSTERVTGRRLKPEHNGDALDKCKTTDEIPDEDLEQHLLYEHTVSTSSGRSKAVYLVGELKIRRRQQPQDLTTWSFRYHNLRNVSHRLKENDLGLHVQNHLLELDLTGNLFSDYGAVAKILVIFSCLQSLNLANNSLGNVDDPDVLLPLQQAQHQQSGTALYPGASSIESDLGEEEHSSSQTCLKSNEGVPSASAQPGTMESSLRQPPPILLSELLQCLAPIPPGHSCVSLPTHKQLRRLNILRSGLSSIRTLLTIGHALPNLEELCIAHNHNLEENWGTYHPGSVREETSNVAAGKDAPQEVSKNPPRARQLYPNLPAFIAAALSWKQEPATRAETSRSSEASPPLFDEASVVHHLLSAELASAFPHVQLLDLSNCGFGDGRHIQLWERLPRLNHLCLDDNPLVSLPSFRRRSDPPNYCENGRADHGTEELQPFPMLQNLQLAGTQLQGWDDFSPLDDAPALQALRLRGVPCSKAGSGGGRAARGYAIARWPTLTAVNGSLVTEHERTQAEKMFLRELLEHRNNAEVPTVRPGSYSERRLEQLVDKYPEYVQQVLATRGSHSKTQGFGDDSHLSVVQVTIRSLAAASCTMDPLIRRLPRELPVGRLRALCARHFEVQDTESTSAHEDTNAEPYNAPVGALNCLGPVLHLRSSPEQGFPQELEDDSRTLEYYNVCDGCEILVNDRITSLVQSPSNANGHMSFTRQIEKQEAELLDFERRRQRHQFGNY
jgi:Leucine-rich repeat (LRR) protein